MKVSASTVRNRLVIGIALMTVGFMALIIRLAIVQLWQGDEISAKAEESWRRNIPVTAKRGEIVDRDGDRLAYNVSSPSVIAVPAQIKDAESTAAKLSPLLGMPAEEIKRIITKRQLTMKLKPGGRKISVEKAKQIRELRLPGIVVSEDNKRYYPYTDLASHILGFTGIDNQGLSGLEERYNSALSGKNGNVSFLTDAAGRMMPNSSEKYMQPRDGLNLQLTVDKDIQTIMERELDQAMLDLNPKHIVSIAMDPNTGEILAMASRPNYSPERFNEYPADVYNRNLPVWMTFEPGSTFKIITLAAALEEGKVDLKNEHFFDPGRVEIGGARLRCWKKGGHGSQTFLEVVENSCNPGFVALGNRLGKEKLFEYIRNFGFGQKTGIDVSGEASGILFKLDRVGPVELATTAFGQGVSVTPIQQIAAVSAAINGGKWFKPHIAKRFIHPETGMVVDEIEPEMVKQVISPETSAKVRDALEHVVAQGTGRNAFIDGYRVGGKTGTAQKVINGKYSPDEHIVSFIGFAPADDPKIVIYTAVDDPQGIQFGGLIAAPIVKRIMADSLEVLGVKPREKQVPREYRFDEQPLVTVPNLVGKTLSDLYEDMNTNFLLSKSGSGQTVIHQAPKPGTRVDKGSTIRIYMGEEMEE
ncbi:stage V sporulation protein D [Paenibacillus assamensis]|uniref:stage V sporulation protein D n=1 Tax=Paenibacillus assamensis TaxID=311244 RepID=UPI000406A181|nr:stage V sporulation protein D [Paenibacillus assamensis]